MLEEMVARQPPSAGSRPVAIGSRSIAVSLQPAIPRRVAPQQSPLPLHRSPTIVAQSRSGEAVKCAAQPHCKDAVQRFAVTALSRRAHPPPMGCHLYFARRVTFLSCADSRQPTPRHASVELATACLNEFTAISPGAECLAMGRTPHSGARAGRSGIGAHLARSRTPRRRSVDCATAGRGQPQAAPQSRLRTPATVPPQFRAR
jgi:hypothetical protein